MNNGTRAFMWNVNIKLLSYILLIEIALTTPNVHKTWKVKSSSVAFHQGLYYYEWKKPYL